MRFLGRDESQDKLTRGYFIYGKLKYFRLTRSILWVHPSIIWEGL